MTRTTLTRIAFALALFPFMAGCGIIDSLTGPGESDIVYRVSGTAIRASVRYETENGTSETSSTSLPWTYTRKADSDDHLFVSAQIVEGDGTVTAAIYNGEDLLNSSTSTGAGAIATASATLQ